MPKPTAKVRLAVYDYLKTCVTVDAESGFSTYTEGHSDKTVAAHFGVPRSVVSGVRKAGFGTLRPPRPKIEQPKSGNRHLDTLFSRLIAAEEMLDNLRVRVERLEKLFKVPA